MSDLKSFVDTIFSDIRARVESEYKHQLETHFKSLSSDISYTHFTPNHGEIKSRSRIPDSRLILPKPLAGRWWIHTSNRQSDQYGFTLDIYDNYGQCFTRKVSAPNCDFDLDCSSCEQTVDTAYQYPLPDCIIDFVKKQGALTRLNVFGDMFHQIIFAYAI